MANKIEIIEQIEIKDLKDFAPNSKAESEIPYIKIAEVVRDHMGLERTDQLHADQIMVTPATAKKLKKYLGNWVKKSARYLKRGTSRFDSAVNMIDLDIGPSELRDDVIYVRKKQ